MTSLLAVGLLGLLLPGTPGDVVLKDTRGRTIAPLERTGKPATVYFFLLSECPNANAYAPEINRIVAKYQKQNVALTVVMVDPSLSATSASRHAKDYGFRAPILLDPSQKLTQAAGVKISPSAAVFDRSMRLVYSGRIDDLFYQPGRRRPRATRHDLREAVDATLAGKPVKAARTTAIGCILPTPER
jgi:peroxiredoxin